MSAASRNVDNLLDLAEDALDGGQPAAALDYCDQVLQHAPGHPGATFLAAEAYRELGYLAEAENAYRVVTQRTPNHSAGWSGLASVLFDQFDFEASRTSLARAIRLDPTNPEAYYWRAMLRERNGDTWGAQRDFRRASLLDPQSFPAPIPLDDATVEAIIEEALLTLHPAIRTALCQVPIILEEVPDEEVCHSFEPPAPPGELLGYYAGVPIADRNASMAWTSLPSAIVLFRKNLERLATNRERLIDELRVTLYHEVGHFLGLSEADLADRGLE